MSQEWHCTIGGYGGDQCEQAHYKAQLPTWKGDRQYPAGHDRCGWVEVPEIADKKFAPPEET